jgi:archaeosine synthase beta-subunit
MSKLPGFRTDGGWIRSFRGAKHPSDPYLPYGWFNEQERGADGIRKEVSVILLTNRECPYSCLMCDLWKHTTDERVPPGAIPVQIEYALDRLSPASMVKLYNSGSWFDPAAIPAGDDRRIASLLAGFRNILVESHPSFLGDRTLEFAAMLEGQLQVAIGLETVHPDVLPRLNKYMSLEDYRSGVEFLGSNGIQSRTFILLRPPFLSEEEGVEWACRSLDFAFDCGVDVCSVIPVRKGNGALDHLESEGYFREPTLSSLERVLEYGIGLGKGLVFADLWDLERFSGCGNCFGSRKERLEKMNRDQQIQAPVHCSCSA